MKLAIGLKCTKNVYFLYAHFGNNWRQQGAEPMAKINPSILQTLRRRKHWSQDRLAEMATVNKQTVSRIERGEQDNTRENTIKRLARALGVEAVELTRE